MKTSTKCMLIWVIILGFSVNELSAQSYCVPPPYQTGPFTGVTQVKVGSLNNSSPYNDGYKYFENVEAPIFKTGSSYNIEIETVDLIVGGGFFTDKLNTVIYIDWNNDGDFEDNLEEAFISKMHDPGTVKGKITVPGNAKIGASRMRIYEDMPVEDGHIEPNPCGYLNSSNVVGQHGEVEDYNIEIQQGSTSMDENAIASNLLVYNELSGGVSVQLTLDQQATVSATLYDLYGREAASIVVGQRFSKGSHTFSLNNYSALKQNIYLLNVVVDGRSYTQKILIDE